MSSAVSARAFARNGIQRSTNATNARTNAVAAPRLCNKSRSSGSPYLCMSFKASTQNDISLAPRSSRKSTAERKRVVTTRAADEDDMEGGPTPTPLYSGKPNAIWRFLSCIPYLIPLFGAMAYGIDACDASPLLGVLINVFGRVMMLYFNNQLLPFLIFFSLFLVVVRNNKLPHFIRFNTMQAILLDICCMLGGLIIQYMPYEIKYAFIGEIATEMVFVSVVGAFLYALYHTLNGKYADMPIISEAVYIQVGR